MSADVNHNLIDLLDNRERDPNFQSPPTGNLKFRNIDMNRIGGGGSDLLDYSKLMNYECMNIDEAIMIYTNGIKNMMHKAYFRLHNS